MKHNQWWENGYGGGVMSKNQEKSENEKKWSVIGEVSGFKIKEII